MRKTPIALFLVMATVGAFCLLSACGGGSSSSGASNGEVVIYSPNSDSEIAAIIPAFEEATGIRVILQSMGTGDVIARLEAEKENPQADVNWGAVTHAFFAQHPDLYEYYISPNDQYLPKEHQNSNGYITYTKVAGRVLIINENVFAEIGLNPDEFTGYKDLLRPELKGRIAMGDPASSSAAWGQLLNMLLVMGDEPYDEKAWEFVEAFAELLNGIILSSSSQVYRGTADGEYAVGLSYEDPCISLLIDGAQNVRVVYPEEGAVFQPSGASIVKGAKNMDNAKAFIDFIISEEGQRGYADTTIRSVIPSIENTSPYMIPLSEINMAYEDIEYCTQMRSEWVDRWVDLTTRSR